MYVYVYIEYVTGGTDSISFVPFQWSYNFYW